MRKRFRGNQPIAVSKELEGEKGGQLYADGLLGSRRRKQEEGEGEMVVGNDGEARRVVK